MALPEPIPIPEPKNLLEEGTSKCTAAQFKTAWENNIVPCIVQARNLIPTRPKTYGELWGGFCKSILGEVGRKMIRVDKISKFNLFQLTCIHVQGESCLSASEKSQIYVNILHSKVRMSYDPRNRALLGDNFINNCSIMKRFVKAVYIG